MGEKKKTGCLTLITAWVLGILVLGGIFSAVFSDKDAPSNSSVPTPATGNAPPVEKPKSETTDFTEIYIEATKAVQEKLKAPSTAIFPHSFDRSVKMTPYGYHQWIVFGIVDAQNDFGAMLRYDWMAVMVDTNESWFAGYLEIGDSEYGTLPVSLPFPLTPAQIAQAKADAAAAKAAIEKKRPVKLPP
jgi:hypothetical protein